MILSVRQSKAPKASMGSGVKSPAIKKHIRKSVPLSQPKAALNNDPKASMGSGVKSPATKKHIRKSVI